MEGRFKIAIGAGVDAQNPPIKNILVGALCVSVQMFQSPTLCVLKLLVQWV